MTTSNTTNSDADGGLKRRARSIQTKLNEYNAGVSLGQAYEIMAIANGFRNWATMNAAPEPTPVIAPMVFPEIPDPSSVYLRHCVGYNSNPVDGHGPVNVADDDYSRHFSVLGGDQDRLAVMVGLSECALRSGGGLILIDHSQDRLGEEMVKHLGHSLLREDVVVIDMDARDGYQYDPFNDLNDGLGAARIVMTMMRRYFDSDITLARTPVDFEGPEADQWMNAIRMVVEAARFAAARDGVPLDVDLILAMAEAKTFFAVAQEDWESGDGGYWLPLSLKTDMKNHCRSFREEDETSDEVPFEMMTFHRFLKTSLRTILPNLPRVRSVKSRNIHGLLRDRRIAVVRVDTSDEHEYLTRINLVLSELELAMQDGFRPREHRAQTKSVVALNGFRPAWLEGVHKHLASAKERGIVIMSNALPADHTHDVNVATVKNPSRLTVEMAWRNASGHPVEFEVLDRRPSRR